MPTSQEALRLFGEDILNQIRQEAEAVGEELSGDADLIAEYAAQRADALALALGEPGFEEALTAARNSLALKAATAAVTRADQLDARILGVARSSLALAARGIRLLSGAAPTT